jgi:hypothetical protein
MVETMAMEAFAPETDRDALARARALAGPILVWAVWGVMTAATILFIRNYSRNIPYMDDLTLVPIMTGHEPVSLRWLWSQHNEHRPVVSRLILVGLYRFISCDFRLGPYFNAALLAGAAASMIVLVRRLRGHTSWFDVALPLAILNIGQAETLLLGLAMALMLTSWITCELIRLASAENSHLGWSLTLKLGLLLVLLPLCGAGGLIMLPPLLLWLACATSWAYRREGDPARAKAARWIGVGLFVVCVAVAALYMLGYERPANHPAPTSFAAVLSTLLACLSLVVWPILYDHWRVAGWFVVFLVAATLARLCWVARRQPDERPRVLAMVAVILAILCSAAAVGVGRAFMGPEGGRVSRYVTTTAPLFCALYVAWLDYGSARARRFVHVALLSLIVAALPANFRFGLEYGNARRTVYTRLERGMKAHSSISAVVKKAWPYLYPNKEVIEVSFKMLKEAHVGRFGDLVDDSLAAAPNPSRAIR